ncbi:MAG TPA: thiamine phosphate synthase [Kiritimatiellia bacterium]|nr:thiamine phosphate synthase [Kiritimatiellia bacterium]HMO99502.1 thiamine phosphate synthase [Kiritimatiellia bacterium]HMP97865.1 thiamine phosphate synthase [Kiritimatiellia bacterium]
MSRYSKDAFSLCLVTDRGLCRDRLLEDVIIDALKGGVSMIQLREKSCSTRTFVRIAESVLALTRAHGVPLIINDRVDVALAVGAEGVHLGQSDLPAPMARRLLGPDKVIGLSVENVEQARAANDMDVDYLGVSPVFATPTKADAPSALGLSGLSAIRAVSRHVLVAIGGIHGDNAADVLRAGADGLAVVSAICSADDPTQATRTLATRVRETNRGGEA